MAEQDKRYLMELLQTLGRLEHGNLTHFVEPGLDLAKADPEIFVHQVARNHDIGKVRDSKVALPVLGLRALSVSDQAWVESTVACMLSLGPRELVRALEFSGQLTIGTIKWFEKPPRGSKLPGKWHEAKLKKPLKVVPGLGAELKRGIEAYLRARESSKPWITKTIVQHRAAVYQLYRWGHIQMDPFVQRILVDKDYPKGSVFEAIANLKTMSPEEAAGVIRKYKLPAPVIVGAVSSIKDKAILMAMIDAMSGNEVANYAELLKKHGAFEDPVLQTAYDQALERAAEDERMDTMKAAKAAEHVSEKVAKKLEKLQEKKFEQATLPFENPTILADKSGSMEKAVEISKQLAAVLAKFCKRVNLVYFDHEPRKYEVTGKSLKEIQDMTKSVSAGGGTSIGCGAQMMADLNIDTDAFFILSDGGDGGGGARPLFSEAYPKYCHKMGHEPIVKFWHVRGTDSDHLSALCQAAGIEIGKEEVPDVIDLQAIQEILRGVKPTRYGLLVEIMEWPLKTYEQVLKVRKAESSLF